VVLATVRSHDSAQHAVDILAQHKFPVEHLVRRLTMSTEHAEGPHKVVLATFRSHDAAQHAVDILAQHKFPVEHVTIVGTGLKLQEQVLGRWTLARALLTGAGTGGWIGLLIGLIFWIFIPRAVWAVPSAIIVGTVFGTIWAAIAYAFRQRAFAAAPVVVADRYDVLVNAEYAEQARRILTDVLSATDSTS
jgi:hypothetical protein